MEEDGWVIKERVTITRFLGTSTTYDGYEMSNGKVTIFAQRNMNRLEKPTGSEYKLLINELWRRYCEVTYRKEVPVKEVK